MTLKTTISNTDISSVLNRLSTANQEFHAIYPGDRSDRQPVHTVYGGANLFRSNVAERMTNAALNAFETYAPNFVILSRALELPGHNLLPTQPEKIKYLCSRFRNGEADDLDKEVHVLYNIYNKVKQKLEQEALEDFRIDFEDGFGNRPDSEEDETAKNAALETAAGISTNSLPPFIGIRIKPFTEDLKDRGIRTLDIYLSTLLEASGGVLPENFVVMLPKVTIPEQPAALASLFEIIEKEFHLKDGTLKMEMMVETTQSIMSPNGTNPLRKFIEASKGRCVAMHFGTYDYTASCNITAKYQNMSHPVCDFAHHMTK